MHLQYQAIASLYSFIFGIGSVYCDEKSNKIRFWSTEIQSSLEKVLRRKWMLNYHWSWKHNLWKTYLCIYFKVGKSFFAYSNKCIPLLSYPSYWAFRTSKFWSICKIQHAHILFTQCIITFSAVKHMHVVSFNPLIIAVLKRRFR